MDASDPLLLYPGGYPVHIDVPQAQLGGLGTAMHFQLPPHAHNFPLTHSREHKLIVALAGSLRIQQGVVTLARLEHGDAMLVAPHGAHRIRQDGLVPSVVGVALWPGAVEQAFRAVAALVDKEGFERRRVAALFGHYGITWEAGAPRNGQACAFETGKFSDLLPALPEALAAAVAARWAACLALPP